MKLVTWTDKHGYRRRAYVRDIDPDDYAQGSGVPADIPDLDKLDWSAIKCELHNLLTDRNLATWQDIQQSQNGITSVVNTVFTKHIISLYRQQEAVQEVQNE